MPSPPLCLPRNPLRSSMVITAPSFLLASYDLVSSWFLNPTPALRPCLGPSGCSGTLHPSMRMGTPDATPKGLIPLVFPRKQQDRGPVLGRETLTPAGRPGGTLTKEVLVWPKFIGYTESPHPLPGDSGSPQEEMEGLHRRRVPIQEEKCLNKEEVQGHAVRPRPCRG